MSVPIPEASSSPETCIICLDSLWAVPAVITNSDTVKSQTLNNHEDLQQLHVSPGSTPSMLCSLESCNHIYHSQCILEWAERSNSCPSCRAMFSKLYVRAPENPGHIFEELHIPERKQQPTSANIQEPIRHETATDDIEDQIAVDYIEESLYENCVICQSDERSHELLICEGCERTFHITCLGLDGVPFEAWYCPSCEIDYNAVGSVQFMRPLLRSGSRRSTRSNRPARTVASLEAVSPFSAITRATRSPISSIYRTRSLSSRLYSGSPTSSSASSPSPPMAPASPVSPRIAEEETQAWEVFEQALSEQAIDGSPSRVSPQKEPGSPHLSDSASRSIAKTPLGNSPNLGNDVRSSVQSSSAGASSSSSDSSLNNPQASYQPHSAAPPKKLKRPSRSRVQSSTDSRSSTTRKMPSATATAASNTTPPINCNVSSERGESVQSLLSHIRSSPLDLKLLRTPSSLLDNKGRRNMSTPGSEQSRSSSPPTLQNVNMGSPRERSRLQSHVAVETSETKAQLLAEKNNNALNPTYSLSDKEKTIGDS